MGKTTSRYFGSIDDLSALVKRGLGANMGKHCSEGGGFNNVV